MNFFGAPANNFRSLRPPVRALVLIYWIYAFADSMLGVFVQIFLYEKFTSITLNIIATIVSYTGIAIGFCVVGFVGGIWGFNIKHSFLASFIVTSGAVLYFLSVTTTAGAYTGMLLWGLGAGLFWLAVNTLELSETVDEERDLYSSLLKAGSQALSLLGPACATVLIWISGALFHLGTYTLLFTVAPAVYLLGFFCFSKLRDYRPPKVTLADVAHHFTDRANQAAQLYTFGMGFQQFFGSMLPPLVTFLILGTALKVGMFDTFFALFSALAILAIAGYRTRENRLVIFGITTVCIAASIVWLGFALDFTALVVYTVTTGILWPVMSVSEHVTNLSAMELGRKETDFYATMLLRDFFLWVWRSLGGVVFLGIVAFEIPKHTEFSIGLYLFGGGLLLMYFGAVLFVRIVRRTVTEKGSATP